MQTSFSDKIASNNPAALDAFLATDHVKNLKDLDLEEDTPLIQRSLSWDLTNDMFTYSIAAEDKSYPRMGVLSTVNSIFDPLGIITPVTVYGRFLLRKLTADSTDWDVVTGIPSLWKGKLNGLHGRTLCKVLRTLKYLEHTAASNLLQHKVLRFMSFQMPPPWQSQQWLT